MKLIVYLEYIYIFFFYCNESIVRKDHTKSNTIFFFTKNQFTYFNYNL